MTQDPGLSAEKVAELEHRLADAAAEVAKVQAQLVQAQQPSSGVPGATIPAAPSAGTEPHVIMINGQQVTPGSGDLASMLRQFMPAAGAGATPLVLVNGQQVSGGQPIDLSAYLNPQLAAQIQGSLSQLGLDSRLGALFGHGGIPGAPPPPPQNLKPLADPPRHVPLSYKLATFNLSVYELFVLPVAAVVPLLLWPTHPTLVPVVMLVLVLGLVWFRGRRYLHRNRLLKWGKVATVTKNDTLSAGTYYGGMTYNNMRLRSGTGWDMTTSWYNGPGYTNKVDYTLDGQTGSLKYRGLLYTDGVILADSRDPSRSMTVSQFPYPIRPRDDGQWPGTLSAWLWGGIIATLVIELTVVYVAAASVLDFWVNR
jgi:hypothetical protein